MARKVRKSLPWLVILALVFLTTIGVNFLEVQTTKGAATSTTSGDVNNVAPSVTAVSLSDADGGNLQVSENSTTTFTVTATITDTNGGADISSCTAVIYEIAAGDTCSVEDNNCYTATCVLGAVSGDDKNATATADIWFIANPGNWGAKITGTDLQSATGNATDTTPVTLDTLNAVIVAGTITYDALDPGQNMSNLTKQVNATTTGNAAIDIQLKGDDMTYGATGTVAVTNQRYATSSAAWASGISASSTYVSLELDMSKPTSQPSTSTDIIYWGWQVPSGTPPGTYTGINYFNAVSD